MVGLNHGVFYVISGKKVMFSPLCLLVETFGQITTKLGVWILIKSGMFRGLK